MDYTSTNTSNASNTPMVISCEAFGGKVSSHESQCPHCGHPMSAPTSAVIKANRPGCAVAILMLLIAGLLFFYGAISQKTVFILVATLLGIGALVVDRIDYRCSHCGTATTKKAAACGGCKARFS